MNRLFAIGAAIAASALLAACGSSNAKPSNVAAAPESAGNGSAPAPSSGGSGGLTERSTEYAFSQPKLTAKAGKVKLTLVNKGSIPHELVVLKTDAAAGSLPVSGARVSEKTAVGEIPEIAGGATKSATLDLKPGHYVFVCNIPGHYKDGMDGELVVR